MVPKRISVKLFAQNPDVVDVPAFTPVLQRWIQQRTVEGMLIDVVDYKHMHEGPGIILIGDEGDYALDLRDGRPGLMYTLKRVEDADLPGVLQTLFRRALAAALQLEAEESLTGLHFDYGEAKLEFMDRLNFPNKPETAAQVEAALSAFASTLFDGDAAVESAHEDPRETFAVCVSTDSSVDGAQALTRISSAVTEG